MRKMKKLLSLLLVLAMTISLAVPAAAASDFTDVSDKHPYYSAIQSLVARGIISGMGDGTFAPDASIKRSEFAKMVILSIGMGNISTTVESTGFPDVATDHWAAGYIKAAHGQGIINGYDDGTFKPDAQVTYEQAIAMVIRAKSTFLKAEAEKIGYPDGYIQIATKYRFINGITDGVKGEPAKRATIAKLMDNSIKVELPKDVGGIPTLDDGNKMEELKGQIIAINGTSLLSGDADTLNTYQFKLLHSNDPDDVTIFDARNLAIKDSLRSYLGKKVVVYYEEDISNDIQVPTAVSEQRGRNYEEELSLTEITDYSNDFVEYDNGEDEVKIYVDDPIIMYNGTVTSDALEDLITANLSNSGSIRFLSTDGEGEAADVIFFTSYTNWYVTSTISSSKTVYGEVNGVGGQSIVVDDESTAKTVTIIKDGRQVEFRNIAKNQILSISESTKVIEVLISDKTVSGQVTAKDATKNTIKVQGKEYTFAGGLSVADINLGVSLKLYLDAFGQIARYTEQMTSTNYVYGYLLNASNDGNAMNGKVAMSVLKLNTTSNTTPAQLYLADTVRINNTNYQPSEDADEIITILKENAAIFGASSGDYAFTDEVCQPIRYSTGNDGKINILNIGKSADSATDADLKINNSFVDSSIECTTGNAAPVFQRIYKLNSSTKVVYVPETPNERKNNTCYEIRNGNNSGFIQGGDYKLLFVDMNASYVPAVVVVYSGEAPSSTEWEDCKPEIVTERNRLEGMNRNQIVTQDYAGLRKEYIDETGTFYNAVKIGDVVRISAASDGLIEAGEIVAEATKIYNGTEYIKPVQNNISERTTVDMTGDSSLGSSRPLFKEGDRSVTREVVIYAGAAFDATESAMLVAMAYPDANTPWTETSLLSSSALDNINISGARVVAVEFDGSSVEVNTEATADQIKTYKDAGSAANKLVVYCYGDIARMIVIYRAAE